MDPVDIKFLQLIVAELFGIALATAGIWLFLRGATGRMSILVEGMGLKARLTNATPGGIVFLLGCLIVIVTITVPSVEKDVTTKGTTPVQVLEDWLHRSKAVAEDDSYEKVQDVIWGTNAVRRARVEILQLPAEKTLGGLAADKHGDERLWRLIAVINKDRGYFKFENASPDTVVPRGAVIELWHPSRFYDTTTETRVRIAGTDKQAAYDHIMALIDGGARWGQTVTFSNLEKRFRDDELVLAYSPAVRDGAETLRELSLKYYGNARYWPLLAWVNRDMFGDSVAGSTRLPDESLWVIHLFP